MSRAQPCYIHSALFDEVWLPCEPKSIRNRKTSKLTAHRWFPVSLSPITCCMEWLVLLTSDHLCPPAGAIEKQKLVYILNRDAQAHLTISSPLEAHKSNTLVYHVVGVDVGFDNPLFSCLEIDYEVGILAPGTRVSGGIVADWATLTIAPNLIFCGVFQM